MGNSGHRSYNDELVDSFERDAMFEREAEEEALRSQFVGARGDGSRRTRARDKIRPDDSVPLFLSSNFHDADPQDLDSLLGNSPGKALGSRRAVKAGLAALSVVVIAIVALSVVSKRTVVENAKASIFETPEQVALPKQDQALVAAPALHLTRDGASAPMAARPARADSSAPTRDEITAAFQTARLRQMDPPPAETAAPTVRRLNADELAALLTRAKSLIAAGDIAPARLLLERAAGAHDANATLLLAQTYDPAVLGKLDQRSIVPDPATARLWYQKAAQFGSENARQRLAQMQN